MVLGIERRKRRKLICEQGWKGVGWVTTSGAVSMGGGVVGD